MCVCVPHNLLPQQRVKRPHAQTHSVQIYACFHGFKKLGEKSTWLGERCVDGPVWAFSGTPSMTSFSGNRHTASSSLQICPGSPTPSFISLPRKLLLAVTVTPGAPGSSAETNSSWIHRQARLRSLSEQSHVEGPVSNLRSLY